MSPTVRTILTAVAAGVAAVGTLLASGSIADAPQWVGIVVAVSGAVFAALGVVPPQVGGQQLGIVKPTVVDQPPSPNIVAAEHGQAGVGLILFVVVVILLVVVLKAITGSWLALILLLLLLLAFAF